METRVDVIRNKSFTMDKLRAAVEYCLPYDDEGHRVFRRMYNTITRQSDTNLITIQEAMYVFSKVIYGSEDEKSRTDRFIGFLCGERVGYYESLEELYEMSRIKNDEP